jgi:serine/threonine protein kinase
MKETLKISDRFNLSKKLGQGTFSNILLLLYIIPIINIIHVGFIYEAYDKVLKKNVALKIEKKDKNKTILYFEYNVLNVLKGTPFISFLILLGLKHVCNVYDFVKNSEQNLIVMDLLGTKYFI